MSDAADLLTGEVVLSPPRLAGPALPEAAGGLPVSFLRAEAGDWSR